MRRTTYCMRRLADTQLGIASFDWVSLFNFYFGPVMLIN